MLNRIISKFAQAALVLSMVFVMSSYAQSDENTSNLTATVDSGKVDLEWTAPMSEVVSFNVYRAPVISSDMKTDPSQLQYEKVGTTKELTFTDEISSDKSEKPETMFYYYVSSLDKDGHENILTNYAHVDLTEMENNMQSKL